MILKIGYSYTLSTKFTVYKLATYTQAITSQYDIWQFGSLSSLLQVYLAILITCKSVNVVTGHQTKTILNTP